MGWLVCPGGHSECEHGGNGHEIGHLAGGVRRWAEGNFATWNVPNGEVGLAGLVRAERTELHTETPLWSGGNFVIQGECRSR